MQEFITIEELCKRLGVSRQTVYTWRKEYDLPYIQTVRTIRFDWEEVQKWLKEQR